MLRAAAAAVLCWLILATLHTQNRGARFQLNLGSRQARARQQDGSGVNISILTDAAQQTYEITVLVEPAGSGIKFAERGILDSPEWRAKKKLGKDIHNMMKCKAPDDEQSAFQTETDLAVWGWKDTYSTDRRYVKHGDFGDVVLPALVDEREGAVYNWRHQLSTSAMKVEGEWVDFPVSSRVSV